MAAAVCDGACGSVLDGGAHRVTGRGVLRRGLFSHFTPTLQLSLVLAALYVASYTYDADHDIFFPAGRPVVRHRNEVS